MARNSKTHASKTRGNRLDGLAAKQATEQHVGRTCGNNRVHTKVWVCRARQNDGEAHARGAQGNCSADSRRSQHAHLAGQKHDEINLRDT